MVDFTLDKIFIYPTDSVWGIGAAASSAEGNNWIRSFKGRAEKSPFSILFGSYDQMENYLNFDYGLLSKEKVLEIFDLQSTFLIPKDWYTDERIGPWVYGESTHIGIRVLALPWIKEITLGGPITSTSFNITGDPSITEVKKARELFEAKCSECSFVYPTKDHRHSLASTIIKIDGNDFSIIRAGGHAEKIREILEI